MGAEIQNTTKKADESKGKTVLLYIHTVTDRIGKNLEQQNDRIISIEL